MYTREELLSDIPLETAIGAYHGTSFSPEQRGANVRANYADQLLTDYATVAAQATPEQLPSVQAAFAAYRQRMKSLQLPCLHAHSRGPIPRWAMSTMITGPANFPTRSNAKKSATYDRRVQEMIDYRTRALKQIAKLTVLLEDQPIRTGESAAQDRLQQRIQELEALQTRMKAANAAIRRHAKAGREAADQGRTIAALVALNFSTEQAAKLLTPDFLKRIGFADYELSNNNANIRRLKAQLAKAATFASMPTSEETLGAVTITDNAEADRAQRAPEIIFPDKPSTTIRDLLKSNGFHWSPRSGAWQRFRSNAARTQARQIVAKYQQETAQA